MLTSASSGHMASILLDARSRSVGTETTEPAPNTSSIARGGLPGTCPRNRQKDPGHPWHDTAPTSPHTRVLIPFLPLVIALPLCLHATSLATLSLVMYPQAHNLNLQSQLLRWKPYVYMLQHDLSHHDAKGVYVSFRLMVRWQPQASKRTHGTVSKEQTSAGEGGRLTQSG